MVSDWYITFIKTDLPQPTSPVKKICNGSTTVNGENNFFFKHNVSPSLEKFQIICVAHDWKTSFLKLSSSSEINGGVV